MKIGITERGDPSIDFSWKNKIEKMDGTVIITKNLTDGLIDETRPYWNKIIFHISCTGYGGTIVEPNIPEYTHQLNQAYKLLVNGVPSEKIVIRVDPIIPTQKGLKLANEVIHKAYSMGFKRFRISMFDAYPHVRERMKNVGIDPPYGDSFYPTKYMIKNVNGMVKQLKATYKDISVESCAEETLFETEQIGCISEKDLKILNLDCSKTDAVGYQRTGCLCCSAKTELLSEKKRCPYKCMYCYWKD